MQWIRQWRMVVVMAIAVVVGWLGTAGAEPPAYRNYGLVRGGYNGFTGDLEDADYDSSANFAVAYGRYLTPNLVLEAGLDVFGADKTIRDSTPAAGQYEREDALAAVGLLATIKGELPVGPLTLFGGGGAGGYLLALYSEIDTQRLGDLEKDSNDTVFGVHAVAGVNFAITQRFFAGLQGLYRWTEDIDIDESTGTVPVRLKGDLSGYSLMLTAGFRF
jgi:opacity protein-like surface antigen